MDEFDAGHNYKDEESAEMKELRKSVELTDQESKEFVEFTALLSKKQSEFTFWMKEHQGNPKTMKVQFSAELTGEVLATFVWIQKMFIDVDMLTRKEMVTKMLEAGIQQLHTDLLLSHAGKAQEMMSKSFMAPDIVRAQMRVQAARDWMKQRKEVKDKNLNDSLGGV